jgi:TRAP-type C4-dicarboxylate transport system substrate-binding protein
MKNVVMAIGAVALFMVLVMEANAGTRIKIATLAPEGTSWMKVMNEMSKEVKEKTGGEVKLKFYAGGVMGDEGDVIRKVKFGQLHGGGFTGRGLGEINSDERILELPNLFKNDKEVDCVVNVHNPAVVLLQAPGAQCEAEGREVMTDDQIRDFSEILALEQWLRKQIAEESD